MKKVIGIAILLVAMVANTNLFNESNNEDSILSLKNVLNHANAQFCWDPFGEEEEECSEEGYYEVTVSIPCGGGFDIMGVYVAWDYQDAIECQWTMIDQGCASYYPC